MFIGVKTARTIFDDSQVILNENGEKCYLAWSENDPKNKYLVSHSFIKDNYKIVKGQFVYTGFNN